MKLHFSPRELFPGQQKNEKIYLVTRQHWAIFARRFVVWLVFAFLFLILDPLLMPLSPFLADPEYQALLPLLKTVYLMFLIAALFSIWIIYHLNFQVVTNMRIVDVDQRGLLHHQTSELHLINVEDVTAEIKGIFGTLFNYGTVYVQTAGRETQFEFDNVPNPHRTAKLILDLYEKLPNHRKGEPTT